MTEIERYDDTENGYDDRDRDARPVLEPLRPARRERTAVARQDPAQRLYDWAQAAHAAHEVAVKLVDTAFVPAAFRGKPQEATAAILAGLEIGLTPMNALKAYDIIQGQAAPRAVTQRAIVQAAGHQIWVAEATKTRAVVRGRRKGESQMSESVWTIDRAKDLGLVGKDNWKKQPQAMLIARATSECARMVASDALLGMAYTVEELFDESPDGGTDVPAIEAPPKRRRTAKRAAPAAEPELTPAPVEGEVVESSEDVDHEPRHDPDGPLTDPQLTKIHTALNELGITDRADKLNYCIGVVDRDLTSSKDITFSEARVLIDRIDADLAALGGADPEIPDPTTGDDPWTPSDPDR